MKVLLAHDQPVYIKWQGAEYENWQDLNPGNPNLPDVSSSKIGPAVAQIKQDKLIFYKVKGRKNWLAMQDNQMEGREIDFYVKIRP